MRKFSHSNNLNFLCNGGRKQPQTLFSMGLKKFLVEKKAKHEEKELAGK